MAAALAILLLLSGQAYAHDLWLEKEAGGIVLYYGHMHSSHEGAKLIG